MNQPPISNRQPCSREDATEVLLALRAAGHIAYFAGGCVRDLQMGLEPKDYDVATDAPPPRVRQLFPNTQAVGAAFGVILVRHKQSVIEVATFRADRQYVDGRHPTSVVFTTPQEDAQRRDFTINGLFLDPVNNQVIDYVGGREDIAARRIRAIGQPRERFAEDYLRILRALRFAARFNFQIEANTAAAISEYSSGLTRISPERIAEELRLMLTPATRPAAWELIWKLKLAPIIFRFMSDRLSPAPASLGLFAKLSPGKPIPFGLALAAACLDAQLPVENPLDLLAKPNVSAVVLAMRKTLRISNEESDQMKHVLLNLHPLLANDAPTLAQKKRFLAAPDSQYSRQLLTALAQANLWPQRARELEQEFLVLEKTEYAPAPLLTGDHLVAKGYAPGPKFKQVLDKVYDEQLEGKIASHEQALQMATQLFSQG